MDDSRRGTMNGGLSRYDPYAELRALQKQFFGDEFGNWFSSFRGLQSATTDVYTRNDKELIIEAHLPNFDEKDVDVSVDNGALVIRGEKHELEEDKDKKYVIRESSSSFYRRVRLPERAQTGKIEADIDNGVLKVIVPLKEIPAPKRVQIANGRKKKK